jgi:drug/metabolite transporter (DMT)-like permease
MAAGGVTPAPRGAARAPRGAFVLLVLLTFFWGVNWPLMKWGLAEIGPWSFRALCIVLGSAGLFACAWLARERIAIPRDERLPVALAGFCNTTLWQLCSAYSLGLMGSGRGAIVAYTMPLWVGVFSVIFLGERFTRALALALILGLLGLALLLFDEFRTIAAAPAGALLMLAGAIFWASGVIVLKRRRWELGSFALTGWQMVIGGVPIVLGALALEGSSPLRPGVAALSLAAALGSLYSATVPMIFCQWGWYRVLAQLPASTAAISMLLIPMVGLASSALLVDERVGVLELVALAAIVAAIAIVIGPSLPRRSAA